MGLNVTNYVLQVKGDKSIASGFDHATRTGDNTFSIYFIDGSKVDLTIPLPKDGQDGISVTGISDKGNGKFTLLFSDGSESDPIQCVKGEDGFSPSAKVEKVGKVATITITDKNGTTTATISDGADGQGGSGGSGEENKIDSISVNGINVVPDENKNVDITVPNIDGLAKTEDIPTKVSELTNDSGYLTEHQDISGKVDKVDGKSLIADTEIERLASVDNYDDAQIKTQIQAVANGLMDSVGYSADYKTIDIIAKNGVKKSVNVSPIISHASITELSDVDTTNKATGKALVYNATTSKHEYADVSGTDEKVKMDSSTDAKYLGELLDNVTIANENGELKVKKLDGQEVTITEINYLKGLTMNVMDLVNMFSNGGVKIINTPVATYAELLTLDKSSFIEGISYLVYVLADENHDNAKTTYLVDKDSETPTYFGFADSQRDFTTNPIDLATEITGKLGISNMDSDAIKALFTVDDTYKTETTTNNAFSTHGAKALYDELLIAIGNKANDSDLTAHKDDADIHVSTEDRTKWDSAKTHADSAHAPSNAQENVLETVKVNGTALEVSDKAVNVTVPTTVAELTDSSSYAKKTDIPTTLPANGGNSDTVNNHTVKSDVPENAVFTDTIYDDTEVKESIEELNSNLVQLEFNELSGGKNLFKGDFFPTVLEFNENYTNRDLSKEMTPVKSIVGFKYAIFGAYLKKGTYTFSYTNNTFISLNRVAIAGTICGGSSEHIRKSFTWTQDVDGWTYFSIECDYSESEYNDTPFSITPNIQIEEGATATEYESYIPSVKMLAEENAQQNTEAMDLKMLGWTVPSECPIQNYTDSDGVFHQIVGRVDLGSLEWTYDTLWKATSGVSTIKNLTVNMYHSVYVPTIANVSDIPTNSVKKADSGTLWINNGSSTEKPSGYLYFELATEKTINVDGNEVITKVNDSLRALGKCKNLLNPTLQTTTLNGVTCTDNGDGTYTLNGTATSEVAFYLIDNDNIQIPKGMYKTICSTDDNIKSAYYFSNKGWISDNQFEITQSDILSGMWIKVQQDYICDNVIVKPMLTTNLNATYDDFVPYTGEGETLTHDVAEIKNDLSVKKIELQNVDERVTIQDNGSFIINGFAFVNLLVTFNETIEQWTNFVRLPRPKVDRISVHCENSVKLTIYNQDNLPGDCGTNDIVQSGTEVRLLVNYEVA